MEQGYEAYARRDFIMAEQKLKLGLDKEGLSPDVVGLAHYYMAETLRAQRKSDDEQLHHYQAAARIIPQTKEGADALEKAAWRTPNLAQALRTELKRVGCDPGREEGWTTKAKHALREFVRVTSISVPVETPTPDALAAVTAQKGRICNLPCTGGETEVNGRCVAKPAPGRKQQAAEGAPKTQERKTERKRTKADDGTGVCSSLKSIAGTPEVRKLIGC